MESRLKIYIHKNPKSIIVPEYFLLTARKMPSNAYCWEDLKIKPGAALFKDKPILTDKKMNLNRDRLSL